MNRKIAVLSDSHNRLPASAESAILSADEIWHLGDVCEDSVLDPLRYSGKPLTIVRGNNDSNFSWPLERRLHFGKKTFLLTHIPPSHPPEADVVLCGHTHVPKNEIIRGIHWLNPGSIGLPNKGAPAAWAWLSLDTETGIFSWEPVPVL